MPSGRLLAATRVRDEPALLASAADDFRNRFPDSTCVVLLSRALDARGLENAALACVDRVDAFVGGDPYLDAVRAGICLAARDTAGLRRFVTRSAAREPGSMARPVEALEFALRDGDFVEAKRRMLTIERTPSFAFRFGDDLNGNDRCAAFRKSPQFAEWQRERPAASTTRPTQ